MPESASSPSEPDEQGVLPLLCLFWFAYQTECLGFCIGTFNFFEAIGKDESTRFVGTMGRARTSIAACLVA